MSEIRFSLPQPPRGEQWCGVCAAFYKAAVIAALEKRVKEVEGDGKTGVVWLNGQEIDGLPLLEMPVMTGQSLMAPVVGVTGCCWTHAPAVSAQVSRLALGQGPLPPGLARGSG